MDIYLHNGQRLPVELSIEDGHVAAHTPAGPAFALSDDDLPAVLRGLLNDLEAERAPGIIHEPRAVTRSWRERVDANTHKLTPEMVIDYFARSEVLNIYLDNVKKVLLPLCTSVADDAGPDRLEADLATLRPHVAELRKENGAFHQGKIADLLGLPQTGGSYHRRIVALCEALEAAA